MGKRRRKAPYVPDNCRVCRVHEAAICAPLTRDELCLFQQFKSETRQVPAGQDIYTQGGRADEVFTLLDGWVVLYEILENGRRQVLDFALSGAFLAFAPNLDAPTTHAAQAITDASLCVFPRERLIEMLRAYPEVLMRLAWLTARDKFLAQGHLTNVGRRPARERVAHLLLELFHRRRALEPAGDGDSIALPLTQEHIGDALGLTAVHVNRTLRKLREDGLLALKGRTLAILDPDGLAAIAGFDAETLDGQTPASGHAARPRPRVIVG